MQPTGPADGTPNSPYADERPPTALEGPAVDPRRLEDNTAGMRAEVAAEMPPEVPDIPDGAVAVPLADVVVHVLDPMDWLSRANTALQEGDLEAWAEDCLAPGDYDVWCSVNNGDGPKTGQVIAMFEAYERLSGNSLGKSRASSHSLRRMARR